jgi:hypothetical protein
MKKLEQIKSKFYYKNAKFQQKLRAGFFWLKKLSGQVQNHHQEV